MMFRNFCFTLNNYTDDDEKKISEEKCFSYMIYGREVGENGTKHLQGYAELHKRTRLNALKKVLPRAHIEARRGTQEQAITYCKKDGDIVEIGTPKEQGKRNDIVGVMECVRKKRKLKEIYEEHPLPCAKFYKFIDKYKLLCDMEDKKFEKLEVIVYVGTAGAGKTRKAYELDPNLFELADYTSTIWFDGYDGQETLLLNDFNGGIKFTYLLRLLDGYKFCIPIKGGFTWKKWKRVIITSNYEPSTWYSTVCDYSALERRITEIIKF